MGVDKKNVWDNLKFFLVCIPIVAVILFLDSRNSVKTNLDGDFNSKDIDVDKLVINEIMSSNKGVYADSKGKIYDWIELYNGTDNDINLKNYGLSDGADEKVKWLFPNTVIKSHEYLIINSPLLDSRLML